MTFFLTDASLRRWCFLIAFSCLLGFSGERALAQAAEEKDEEKEYLEGAEELELTTVDGVFLSGHLWVPKGSGKETPIVLLLHMRGRTQRDWYPFAKFLYDNGMSVCTFDFRGHGQSCDVDPSVYKPGEARRDIQDRNRIVERVVPQGSRAVQAQTKPKRGTVADRINEATSFRRVDDLIAGCVLDLQTVKALLVDKHNQGVFNIRRLGLVGAEFGAVMAMEWMCLDEYRPGRHQGFEPVGADIAAVSLISVPFNYEGHPVKTDLSDLANDLPFLMISGMPARTRGASADKETEEANRVARKLADESERIARKLYVPGRPWGNDGEAPKVRPRGKSRPRSGFFLIDTNKIGTQMFRPPIEGIDNAVGGFLNDELPREKTRTWERREFLPERSFGTG